MSEACRVAGRLRPERRQSMARSMRPPSRGNAGNRLDTASTTLMALSHTRRPNSTRDPSHRSTPQAPSPAATAIRPLMAGPAAAMRNSAPGSSASPPSLATPPNNHSVISSTSTPLRWAM